jgi:L-2-hydroxyglutarate oxidase LhgO
MLYALCESHGVEHRRCGKLVVANSEAETEALRSLAGRAAANGVPVEWLSASEARALEPALRCTAALFSPSTGIVDSHGFMLALQGDLERHGGAVAFESSVASVLLGRGGEPHVLRMADGTELAARTIVNAASLHACALARRFEGLAPQYVPQEYFAKGNYYSLAGRAPFSRLIYPAPADAWLGVHLTLDLGGQARFGPDLEWLGVAAPEEIDYSVDPRRADSFYAEVRRYWPELPDGVLQPSYSGVRPKIHAPGELAPDFRIDGPAWHGIPGLVNLFGIESPGLTSSLAIAQEVLAKLSPETPGAGA